MGRHNGHEALSYVPLTDLDPTLADALLDVLSEQGIAAYATPSLRRPVSPLIQPRVDRPLDRVFVDAMRLVRARDVLRTQLPVLRAEHEAEAARQPAPGHSGSSSSSAVLVGDAAWESVLASYAMPSEDVVRTWPEREDLATDDETAPRPPRLLRRGGDTRSSGDKSALPDWAWEPGDRGGFRARRAARRREERMREERDAADWDADWNSAEHFVPPPPEPLPASDFRTRLAWLALFGGPLLLLVGAALDWDLGGWLGLAGVAAFIGGFVALVVGMKDPDPDDIDPDDGAVV